MAPRLVEEFADHPGVVGVCMMTAGARPPLGDVSYNPLYAACERNNLPLVLHGAPGLNLTEGADFASFQSLIESHSLGFTINNSIALTTMLMQGVPERFPDLKVVLLESGVAWIPSMLYRLDESFLKRRSEAPLLKALPSEYIKDRFYFGTQPIEAPKNPKFMELVFEAVHGQSQFLYASDYPHWDYDDPQAILRLSFLSREEKADVFAGNAHRVYNLRKGGIQQWESTSSPDSATSPTAAA